MNPGDLAVMELSSFQLELMTRSPDVAALLNLTPNHLDRHGTMEAYTAAKARILDFQRPEAVAVLSREDPGSQGLVRRVRGRLITFGIQPPPPGEWGTFVRDGWIWRRVADREQALAPLASVRLPGKHNLRNVLAACAIALAAELPPQGTQAVLENFEGLPHRLERVRSWRGADWINDSIATSPERTIAALRSFDRPIVLLAGGRDKDLSWAGLGKEIRRRVDHLIAFGEAADLVVGAVGPVRAGRPYTVQRCESLFRAVRLAAEAVEPGDVVLLSPGGTSFDEFRDFEHRGECFRQWVHELS